MSISHRLILTGTAALGAAATPAGAQTMTVSIGNPRLSSEQLYDVFTGVLPNPLPPLAQTMPVG